MGEKIKYVKKEKPKQELNSYRHLYLYAKGWYLQNDLIEDLKKILSERSGINSEHINKNDIILVLKNATEPHTTFRMFLDRIYEINRFYVNGLTVEDALIKSMLSILSLTKISDIEGDLGDPDEKILPLKRKERKGNEKRKS